MSKWKDISKNGWHPEKDGTMTGLGLRNKAKGMVGRGDSSADNRSRDHIAAPLSSLRDPASFAPPPKRDPTQPLPAPTASYTPAPPTTARPGPQPPARLTSSISQQQDEGVAGTAPRASRGWQLDTTGLSTSHLPPPPGRTGTPALATPPPAYSPVQPRELAVKAPPPSLPPRLPPRSGTNSPVRTASPAPPVRPPVQAHMETQSQAENGYLNQGAMNRLGAAGISVSSLGIGGGSKTSSAVPTTTVPAKGTTWQQKQAALKTASQIQKDPSSVSFSDAKTAVATANNFRQRHGEQVADGFRTANNLGQKFGITEQAKTANDSGAAPGSNTVNGQQQSPGAVSVSSLVSTLGKKKPPAPPPPRKKPELSGNAGGPPPVPMSTRPTF